MANLGFKEITLENWSQPDSIHDFFVKLSPTGEALPMAAEDWIRPLLIVSLSKKVPHDVQTLFEVARGAMVYGYYFYPLWTLGIEQLCRVTEAAVSHKCRSLGAPKSKRRFVDKIRWLENEKVISSTDEELLHDIRELRNSASHSTSQSIFTPGMVIPLMESIVRAINYLFNTGQTRI